MGYIYQIVDTITHEYYIGKSVSKSPLTDGYWGSGYNRVCRSAKKHNGAEGRYRKDILVNGISCKIELGLFEKEIIGNLFERDSLCLNRMAGGAGGAVEGNTNRLGAVISQATKDKISAALKGVPKSDKTKANMSAAQKGRVFSQEHKDKIGASKKGNTYGLGNKSGLGKVLSQTTKDKMSEAKKGNTNSLGIVHTAAQNAAQSARLKEQWRLRKLEEEALCTTS